MEKASEKQVDLIKSMAMKHWDNERYLRLFVDDISKNDATYFIESLKQQKTLIPFEDFQRNQEMFEDPKAAAAAVEKYFAEEQGSPMYKIIEQKLQQSMHDKDLHQIAIIYIHLTETIKAYTPEEFKKKYPPMKGIDEWIQLLKKPSKDTTEKKSAEVSTGMQTKTAMLST